MECYQPQSRDIELSSIVLNFFVSVLRSQRRPGEMLLMNQDKSITII